MGEKTEYQALTTADKLSVLFYRAGLVLILLQLLFGAYYIIKGDTLNIYGVSTYIVILYLFTALSVINIHIYLKRFRYFIRGMYLIALLILIFMLFLKGMHFGEILITKPQTGILLLPLAGCIAFFGVKEAFCFRIMEGYISALLLVLFIIIMTITGVQSKVTGMLLMLTSIVYALFILKKAFMPLAYDIGDKSAYE